MTDIRKKGGRKEETCVYTLRNIKVACDIQELAGIHN